MVTGLIRPPISQFDDYRVLEVMFPNYEKYLPILELGGEDSSPQTYTYFGKQVMFKHNDNLRNPLLKEYLREIQEVSNQAYKDNNIPMRLTQYEGGWYVKYEKGGYQGMHVHGTNGNGVVSTILCFDEFTYPVFVAKVKTPSGRLKQKEFYDKPGVLRIFNSHDVLHGALPTESPRRIIVADYKYELLHNT
jgi:hypothetical protein